MTKSIFDAAASGDVTFIKNHVAQVHDRNERGWTLLHFAARFGHANVATFLINEGHADLNAKTKDGKTAADLAKTWGHESVHALVSKPSQPKEASAREELFLGSNPLNRYGWYRSQPKVLEDLLTHPNAKFVVVSSGMIPMDKNKQLKLFSYEQVVPLVRDVPHPTLVFLGVDERNGKEKDGIPFWALDATPPAQEDPHHQVFSNVMADLETHATFKIAKMSIFMLDDNETATILAQALALVDWHARNRYCPGCGLPTILADSGYKRTCVGSEASAKPCPSIDRTQNYTFPRTDPVVIVCVTHPTEDKILLGRDKAWPQKMYSCLAGFVEPGEVPEDAVRREVLEEVGLQVNRIVYYGCQTWPFPNSLMMGFIAKASTTSITYNDGEIEKAIWVSRQEALSALQGTSEHVKLPPAKAIAYRLIESWSAEPERVNAKM